MTDVVGFDAMPVVGIPIEGDSGIDILEVTFRLLEHEPSPLRGRRGFALFIPIALEFTHLVKRRRES
jgi:hypothetical protein